MASGLCLKSGSPLIGSPIIYEVWSMTLQGACTFHRVNLTVTAKLSTETEGRSLTLSSPTESGKLMSFDISSALRAIADGYEYSPIPPENYPYISYSVSASDDYMRNGVVIENAGEVTLTGGNVLMGAYSDFERLLCVGGNKMAQHFSRKPSTLPEIVMVGETMVCPQSFDEEKSAATIDQGPSSEVVEITQEGLQTVNGRSVYALPSGQSDRYQFRFVNGLGCLESISLSTLRTTEINCTSESYIRTVQETFFSFSRSIVSKTNDYETWKLSTPPLDEAWQSWFVHEFLMSKHVWIEIGGHWIPCHLIPEETIPGMNRVDGSLLSIAFAVRLNINGSPLSALAI